MPCHVHAAETGRKSVYRQSKQTGSAQLSSKDFNIIKITGTPAAVLSPPYACTGLEKMLLVTRRTGEGLVRTVATIASSHFALVVCTTAVASIATRGCRGGDGCRFLGRLGLALQPASCILQEALSTSAGIQGREERSI